MSAIKTPKASGNNLMASKRFQLVGGGGALIIAISLLDVFPEGKTLGGIELEGIILGLIVVLAILYGIQDIIETFMDGVAKALAARNIGKIEKGIDDERKN